MKIIATDNLARENVSDVIICHHVPNYYANLIVKLLNQWSGETGDKYYKALNDNDPVYEFEP